MIFWVVGNTAESDYAEEVGKVFKAKVVESEEDILSREDCLSVISEAKSYSGNVVISGNIRKEELRVYAQLMSKCVFVYAPFGRKIPPDFEPVRVAHFVFRPGFIHSDEVVIKTMRGLGDTIYQRAFIHSGYVDTPWPELFSDKPSVKCVQPKTNLRTQKENASHYAKWHPRPEGAAEVAVNYDAKSLALRKGILNSLSTQLEGEFKFDLPKFGKSKVTGKYAVIKINTVRSEWACPARNCKSEYLKTAAQILKKSGYKVVGIAYISEGEEWIDGVPPDVDEAFYQGELRVTELIDLIREAAVVVSSVGFTVPMTIAAKTKLICIGGGLGAYNSPEVITDPRMDLSKFHFIRPDNYCCCGDMRHKCDKTITDFETRFREVLK